MSERPLLGFLAANPQELRSLRQSVAASAVGLGVFSILFPIMSRKVEGRNQFQRLGPLLDRVLMKVAGRRTLLLKRPLLAMLLERRRKEVAAEVEPEVVPPPSGRGR